MYYCFIQLSLPKCLLVSDQISSHKVTHVLTDQYLPLFCKLNESVKNKRGELHRVKDGYTHLSIVYSEKPFSCSNTRLLKSQHYAHTQKRKFTSWKRISSLIVHLLSLKEIILVKPTTQPFTITNVLKQSFSLNINPNTGFSAVSHYLVPCLHPYTSSSQSNQHLPPLFKCLFFVF